MLGTDPSKNIAIALSIKIITFGFFWAYRSASVFKGAICLVRFILKTNRGSTSPEKAAVNCSYR